jgi:hypothetical protein
VWPFLGGILKSIDRELRVPGQDTKATFVSAETFPFTARIAMRFNASNGDFEIRQNLGAWTRLENDITEDMWIHSDMKDPDIFNASDYEVRFVNVTGHTAYLSGDLWFGTSFTINDGWIDLTSHNLWELSNPDGDWDLYLVNGLVSIRDKNDPVSSLRVGNLDMTAFREGGS